MRWSWVLLLVVGVLAGCSTIPEKETSESAWGLTAPDAARAQYDKAMDYLRKGRQKDAEQIVGEAFQKYPESQRLWFMYAVLALSRQETDAAVQAFMKVRDLNEESLLGITAQLTLDEEIEVADAFKRLKKRIDQNPDEMLLRWLYAMEATRQGVFVEEGAAQFEVILEAWDPAPAMVHHIYATLLASHLNLLEKALEHQQFAAEIEPNAQTYYRLG